MGLQDNEKASKIVAKVLKATRRAIEAARKQTWAIVLILGP